MTRRSLVVVDALVAIVGLGDLGLRIAERLTASRTARLVLAGRSSARGIAHAELLAAADATGVTWVELDASDPSACVRFLREARPDLVIQAACAVSPWTIAKLETRAAEAIRSAGFGAQLPFQTICARSVMTAVREVGFTGPVINCSYPDAVNCLLAGEGLAPTTGVGNVGMMQARVEAALAQPAPRVRMIAHHAQTVSVMSGPPLPAELRPRVYLGAEGARRDELAYRGRAFPWSIATNLLTAAVTTPVVRALLGAAAALHTSAPGPCGLPGGYPIRIAGGGVELDLPPAVERDEAIAFNTRIGELDGIAAIVDGVAHWSGAAERVLRAIDPQLAEPLAAGNCPARAHRLAEALSLAF